VWLVGFFGGKRSEALATLLGENLFKLYKDHVADPTELARICGADPNKVRDEFNKL